MTAVGKRDEVPFTLRLYGVGPLIGRKQGGQARDGRMAEQCGERQAVPEVAGDAGEQTQRHQRVAAEREEIVVAADLRGAKQLAPQRGQALLGAGLGSTEWPGFVGGLRRIGKGRGVDLAVRSDRELGYQHDAVRMEESGKPR